jgi:molybdenum cofactor biosynthesis protein B
MSESHRPAGARVLVAAVTQGKGHGLEGLAKSVGELLPAGHATLVRTVVVKGERQYIRELVTNVSNGNEADAVILVGGSGIGPLDDTCEAVDGFVERRIEGFGEAYRRLLETELGAHAFLARATAGVYNQCLVFAMSGRAAEVTRAVQTLIVPTLCDAVELSTGQRRGADGALRR